MQIKVDDSVEMLVRSLEKSTISKVSHLIDLLEEFGNGHSMPSPSENLKFKNSIKNWRSCKKRILFETV